MKVLSTVFAAIVVAMSLATLHMANAAYSSLSSSPVQPNSKQDAMNNSWTAVGKSIFSNLARKAAWRSV